MAQAKIIRGQWHENLVAIDKRVLQSSDLTAQEKIVFFGLYGLDNQETITTQMLVDYLGMKWTMVDSVKRRLVKKGWLKEIQNNGRGKKYIPIILGDNKNG